LASVTLKGNDTMKTYTYSTGRTYNGAQTLVISHRDISIDEDLLDFVEVKFEDVSRNIKGSVDMMIFELTTQWQVGKAVMNLYDAGAYKNI
jgi:hypothetical protein